MPEYRALEAGSTVVSASLIVVEHDACVQSHQTVQDGHGTACRVSRIITAVDTFHVFLQLVIPNVTPGTVLAYESLYVFGEAASVISVI